MLPIQNLLIPELDNASIRRTPDGKCSVYDLMSIVSESKHYRKTWLRLCRQNTEVVAKCHYFQFPGQGQKPTPVVDRDGWSYIFFLLPGLLGQKYRKHAGELILRYLDADITIAESIVERNNTPADIQRLAKRIEGKRVRSRLTQTLDEHGVVDYGYGNCTNNTYQGLFNGLNKNGLLAAIATTSGIGEKTLGGSWKPYTEAISRNIASETPRSSCMKR